MNFANYVLTFWVFLMMMTTCDDVQEIKRDIRSLEYDVQEIKTGIRSLKYSVNGIEFECK